MRADASRALDAGTGEIVGADDWSGLL